MAHIYKITNTITNKIYIGKTTLMILERFDKHIRNSKDGDTYLYKSFRKYGIENFTIESIEECSDDILNNRECFWIKELNSLIPNGYNMTEGGTGGDTSVSPKYKESMKKMHESRISEDYATYGFLGKVHTSDSKQKQSQARKKHWDSLSSQQLEERSKKISGSKNGMFGKIPKNSIQIILNGIEYNSISEACRATGMSAKSVKKYGVIYNESSVRIDV